MGILRVFRPDNRICRMFKMRGRYLVDPCSCPVKIPFFITYSYVQSLRDKIENNL